MRQLHFLTNVNMDIGIFTNTYDLIHKYFCAGTLPDLLVEAVQSELMDF